MVKNGEKSQKKRVKHKKRLKIANKEEKKWFKILKKNRKIQSGKKKRNMAKKEGKDGEKIGFEWLKIAKNG